ncbi:hypothetical protein [Serratia odorifera]|nr:hypothetical protein [Serratia odorifera]
MKITFTPSFYRLPIGICGLSLPLVIILTQPFEFQKQTAESVVYR